MTWEWINVCRVNNGMMAVIVTLPFITVIQSLFFGQMNHSSELKNPAIPQAE